MNKRLLKAQPEWWLELSEDFLRSLERKQRRPNTQRAYRSELRDFGTWLSRAGIDTLPGLGRRHIEGWQDELRTRKSPRTQLVAGAALRGTLKWAASNDLPLSSPNLWLLIEQHRAPKLKPRPIPLRELLLVCACLLEGGPSLEQLRTRALFWLILSSGARISEALSLMRSAVDEDPIGIIQKGGWSHELVISGQARLAMREYLSARPDGSPAMFISHREGRPLAPLGKKETQRCWDQLCQRLRIMRFTSHQIRHSCATEMLRQGINHIIIAKHMGHRDLTTIQGYAEVDLDSRVIAVQAVNQRLAGVYSVAG